MMLNPSDLSLWQKSKSAPQSERWKWDWNTWRPILQKLFAGEEKLSDLECPVCGKKELYAYFLAVSAANTDSDETGGEQVYIADRWFGCHACQTQVRDRGEIPSWVRKEDVKWASDKLRKRAEQKLAKRKRGTSKTEQDAS